MRYLLLSAASLAAMAAPAAAETFQVSGVDIIYAAANVTVIVEDRANVDVAITQSTRLPALTTRIVDGDVVIDGGLQRRLRGCTSTTGRGDRVRVSGVGEVRRDELPSITLRVPRRLDYTATGAVYSEIGASAGGDVVLSTCADTTLGPAAGDLNVSLNGSGAVRLDRVGGVLTGALNGSGSMRAAAIDGAASLRLNGSGSLHVGDVGGALDARVAGSGSLRTGAVGRGARVALAGSGGAQVGAVAGPLNAQVAGSGTLRVDGVTGPLADLRTSSSGGLIVGGGRVDRLVARASGSGGVRFNGAAGASDLMLQGSGGISVDDAGRVERMVDTGSGSIHLGD